MAKFKLKLQVMCDDAIAIGPGKAELLEQIMATGSIAGAARKMDMSYRRAWQLVDLMNRCWSSRLVDTAPGRANGGARVTELGTTIISRYRDLQHRLETCAIDSGWHDLEASLRETPLRCQAADHSA